MYNEMKAKAALKIKVLNTQKNQEYINSCAVKKSILNLTAIVGLEMTDGEIFKFAPITKELLKTWEVTAEEVFEDALAVNKNYVITDIFSTIKSFLDEEHSDSSFEDCENFYGDSMMMPQVVTTDNKFFGAAVLCSRDFLDKIATILHEDAYYIIPSSVHEIIVVKEGMGKPEDIKAMIMNVNETEVSESDFLSDNLYKYNKLEGLSIAA